MKIRKKSRRGQIPLPRNRVGLLTPHRVNAGLARLRQIPYPRAVRLAGLGSVMARVTRLAPVKLE
jgi:hypothetical protein